MNPTFNPPFMPLYNFDEEPVEFGTITVADDRDCLIAKLNVELAEKDKLICQLKADLAVAKNAAAGKYTLGQLPELSPLSALRTEFGLSAVYFETMLTRDCIRLCATTMDGQKHFVEVTRGAHVTATLEKLQREAIADMRQYLLVKRYKRISDALGSTSRGIGYPAAAPAAPQSITKLAERVPMVIGGNQMGKNSVVDFYNELRREEQLRSLFGGCFNTGINE